MSRQASGVLLAPDSEGPELQSDPLDLSASLCFWCEELEGEGITWAVGMEIMDRLGLKDEDELEVERSSRLSEQEVPMPVSPLSELTL